MKKNNRLLIVVFAVLALIIGVLKGVDYYRYTKVSKERVSSIQAEFVGETAPSQELSMSMFDVTEKNIQTGTERRRNVKWSCFV